MMFGGIAFETPDTLERSPIDIDNLVFTLYASYESIQEQAYTKKIKFVMFFDSSVRGLNIGASVEFKGIKVGSVVDVRLEFDSENTTFRIPVLIEIEPERIVERSNQNTESPYQTLNILVERGLRARLQTGSLLTSQLYVELGMHPDTPLRLSGEETLFPELPTLPVADFGAITESMEDLLARLNALDIEEIVSVLLDTLKGANETLQSANELINTPDIQDSIKNMRASLQSFKSVMQKIDESGLQEVINTGQSALDGLTETLAKTNDLLEPNSPIQYNVIKMTSELEETARSIRLLIETLERNPQAFIFGKDKEVKGE
jgi:paraquat-inducible protein B